MSVAQDVILSMLRQLDGLIKSVRELMTEAGVARLVDGVVLCPALRPVVGAGRRGGRGGLGGAGFGAALDGGCACDSEEKHGCGGGLEHHLEECLD